MNTPMRGPIALASLLFFSLSLSSCEIGAGAKSDNPLLEGACSETTKTFSSAGATRANLTISQLPVGAYRHANAEIYIESKIAQADGTKSLSRVQFLETPIANTNPQAFSTSLRCRETSGKFVSYFMQAALVTDFVSYDASKELFDISSHSYAVNFQTDVSAKIIVGFSGDIRSTNAGTVANTIGSYWNSGYQFAWRGGEIYEFYGVRVEPFTGRTIYGKAVYTRTNLF